jgi:hypothetical protein
MGIALTAAFILCSYAIVSGRGTIPESALLVHALLYPTNHSLHMLSSIYTVEHL